MRMATMLKSALVVGGLAGCAAQPPTPLVALPGPAKTEAQFREDDAACRTEALRAPASAVAQSAASQPAPGQDQASASTATVMPSGVVYLRCMTARQNVVAPLEPAPPALYGYYAPYPVYAGVGFGYPLFYDTAFAPGFYRGGYGRLYGGYPIFGFRHGGFHNGGYHGGGYHGGGHHGGRH